MSPETVYAQAPDCLLENMDGELLLYNPVSATTLHLNGSSAVVWQLCDSQLTMGEIVQALQDAFPDQAEQIAGDVSDVLTDLLRQGAVMKV